MIRPVMKCFLIAAATTALASTGLVIGNPGDSPELSAPQLEARCVSLPCVPPSGQAAPDDDPGHRGPSPLLLHWLPVLRFAPIVPLPLAPPWLQLEMQQVQGLLVG